MILVDTSVWVEFLRRGERGRAATMRDLLQRGEVVLCGPVAAELIAGAAEHEHPILFNTFRSLRWADLDREGWIDVGRTAANLRAAGRKLPLTDLAIAVTAARAGAPLWTYDDDFSRIAGKLESFELVNDA